MALPYADTRGKVRSSVGKIVAGFDGSPESHAALDWAVDAAGLRAVTLEVVYAYEHVPIWQLIGLDSMVDPDVEALTRQEEEMALAVRQQAETLVGEAAAAASGRTGVAVRAVVIENRHPASALLESARDAEMLVVGSRGRGGFAGLLLGSVSRECASRSKCPVVIVGRSAQVSTTSVIKEQ